MGAYLVGGFNPTNEKLEISKWFDADDPAAAKAAAILLDEFTDLGINDVDYCRILATASNIPTIAADQARESTLTSVGSTLTTLSGKLPTAAALADGGSIPSTTKVGAVPLLHNGTTLDFQRSNTDLSLLATATTHTTRNSGDKTNYNWRGIKVFLNMVTAGSGSVTISIEVKDPVSGSYKAILIGTAVTADGVYCYTVYPGIEPIANEAVSDVLSRIFRVVATHNNGNDMEYTVGGSLIL